MPTTSSPTSSRRSGRHSPAALGIWVGVSGLLTTLAFLARSQDAAGGEDVLYEPAFAVGAIFQYGILVGVAYAIARLYRSPVPALGFRRFRARWVWISFGVVLASIVAARIAEPFLHGGEEQGFAPDRWEPEHAVAFGANVAVVVLLAPFAEEVFFRGLGVRVLAPLGGAVAILVSGLVFGLVHGIPGALPPLVLFGIGLAWVRLRSASVWPGVIAHSTYNGLGILGLVLMWATDS